MTTFLELQARDPIVCRDGRPFGAGSGRRMKSQPWPSPSVTAGSLRTAIGKANGGVFDAAMQKKLKDIALAGPFPVSATTLFLPAPADCVVMRNGPPVKARPVDGTTDLPNGLRPVCLPATTEGKTTFGPAWWSVEKLAAWLAESDDSGPTLTAAALDDRTHLEIDPKTFGAVDGMLFATQAAVLDDFGKKGEPQETTLAVRATSPEPSLKAFAAIHPFGGERRLVQMKANDALAAAWEQPAHLKAKLASLKPGDGVRMVLATPAIFTGGWKPSTTFDSVELELVGVKIERWKAISGWCYVSNGPKAIRRTVPAGGVYFFKLKSGDASTLPWLASVSDDPQDQRDGFGLATWGLWTPNQE